MIYEVLRRAQNPGIQRGKVYIAVVAVLDAFAIMRLHHEKRVSCVKDSYNHAETVKINVEVCAYQCIGKYSPTVSKRVAQSLLRPSTYMSVPDFFASVMLVYAPAVSKYGSALKTKAEEIT